MLSLDSPAQAQIVSSAIGPVLLFELDFAQGTQYFCSWNDVINADGHDYLPTGGHVQVSNLTESLDSSVDKVGLRLPLVNLGMLALASTGVENYRGRPGRIYLQAVNENYVKVGAKKLRFSGYMEPAKITRESGGKSDSNPFGVAGYIEVPLSKAGLVRSRNYDGLRITHQQQRMRYPTDNSFEYVKSLQDTPSQWLSIAFQRR